MPNILRDRDYLLPALGIVGLAVIIILVLFLQGKTTACSVIINEKEILIAKDSELVKAQVAKICTEEQKKIGHKVNLSSSITYDTTIVDEDKLTAPKQIYPVLKQALLLKTGAAAIVVNGKPVVYVADQVTADKILKTLKTDYSSCNSQEKIAKSEFCEKVKVETCKIETERVLPVDEALTLLKTGTRTPVIYTVKEGDSLWLIARLHDMHVSEIKEANGLKSENLQLDQKLVLSETKPFINVETVIKGQETETIPYDTKVVVDKSLKYSTKIKQKGEDGEKEVAYTLIKRNGQLTEKKIISQKITKKPVDQVIARGKKVRQPVMVASRGSFIGGLTWPIFGSITSGYGSHRGHTGIDIDGETGDPIHAAKSGVVEFAGRDGSYGLMIIINHGNGVKTRYAHCSKILVKEGQSVTKGQVIGKVGSTGHSTGSHLHFEVIRGSTFNNPLRYLR
ncbi:MAG: peptidoglycan DD-metalloendopeptidase family protein [Candidatus Saccharibacteria bacterium]